MENKNEGKKFLRVTSAQEHTNKIKMRHMDAHDCGGS